MADSSSIKQDIGVESMKLGGENQKYRIVKK